MLCLSIIPQQYKSHPLVQDAINEGFKFNGQENIISLEKYSKTTNQGRHGNHPAYSDEVAKQLEIMINEKIISYSFIAALCDFQLSEHTIL